jgi:glycosyltransferase involved in cell wall biosynthesis
MATNFGMTGVETFILQLVEAQKRAGLRPSVTMDFDGREEVSGRVRSMGIPTHSFPMPDETGSRLPRKLRTAGLRAQRVRALVKLLSDADVLHMHSVGMVGFDAYLAASIARKPVIVTHHTTLAYTTNPTKLDDATFWLEKHVASYSVMPYQAAADELVRGGVTRAKSAVIPYCFDETRFKGRCAEAAPGQLTLVMAARLFDGKGHRELLSAVDSLRLRHSGLRLILVGEGPERAALDAEIDRRGLRDVVQVRGRVDHAAMPALFRTAQVVVLPSYMHGETFPLSLLEAMALGMPAIGTRWFGIPDIIEDGRTGFIVEPRDAEGLASAIERFLVDPSLLAVSGRRAAERVQSRFTASAVAHEYSRLYTKALTAS